MAILIKNISRKDTLMFCKLNSFSLNGITALPISVEIDLQQGLPSFDIVGLPDCAVKEAKERVRSAIKNSGYSFPICHITVNLSPADIKKEGSLYDLPIALGILGCLKIFPLEALRNKLFIGELALDGRLHGIRGALPILCGALTAHLQCILPDANSLEASLLDSLEFYAAHHLKEVVAYLLDSNDLQFSTPPSIRHSKLCKYSVDFSEVHGQENAKRALILAASGYHNTLLIGSPGSGKTMLAQRLPTILPPLSQEECIELTTLYSVAHQLPNYELMTTRPFRSPHHTISPCGLIGGGAHPKPGEISLAHLGVLFLDELLEFSGHSLDLLRQPLESHEITLSRALLHTTYPANFLFIAATNPCPCGYFPSSRCTCSMPQIKKYLTKLSGPLIDRIDIQLELHAPSSKALHQSSNLSSTDMMLLVKQAHAKQKHRFKGTSILYNSQIPSNALKKFCHLTPEADKVLWQWFEKTGASMRAYHKLLRLALTITDIDQLDKIDTPQIAEAIRYRILDYSLNN